jgi:hypothetical protein
MPQVFHRSFNVIVLVLIFGGGGALAAAGGAVAVYMRSPYTTNIGITLDQPVPFSHQHHTSDLGIDCRYCHTSVEDSHYASIPPTKTCMNCHSQIWTGSEMLAPVRESYRTDESIAWNKVHNLAGFVYFNHGIHVNKGVGCVTCHGRVDNMPLMWQKNTLLMEWCLDCHRNPEQYVRPREQVFNMTWSPKDEKVKNWDPAHPESDEAMSQATLGKLLVERYRIRTPKNSPNDSSQLLSCGTCHH